MFTMLKRGLASALALGCALTVAGPAVAQQKTLKMQASWPASLTLFENFTDFAKRLEVVTGGRIKIEAMPAGQIVPAFEGLDAVISNAGGCGAALKDKGIPYLLDAVVAYLPSPLDIPAVEGDVPRTKDERTSRQPALIRAN